jgi:hypothetical protein
MINLGCWFSISGNAFKKWKQAVTYKTSLSLSLYRDRGQGGAENINNANTHHGLVLSWVQRSNFHTLNIN